MQEQKLVTFYLESDKEYVRDESSGAYVPRVPHEHLSQYLEDGWVVKSIDTLGGKHDVGRDAATGWVVVLLERLKI